MHPASDDFTYSVVLVHLPYHGVTGHHCTNATIWQGILTIWLSEDHALNHD
jgi:hypothetical protein